MVYDRQLVVVLGENLVEPQWPLDVFDAYPDPDSFEVRLYQRACYQGIVVRGQRKGQRKPMRVTGLSKELFGLRGVVRIGLVDGRHVPGVARYVIARDHPSIASSCCLQNRLLVGCVLKRLPDFKVSQWAIAVVERHLDFAVRRARDQFEATTAELFGVLGV